MYVNPPDHALVFCVDEKSQIQALDRTQPLLPMQPGQLERGIQDYKRNGTTSLFAALELKTSRVIGQLRRRHRAVEFREFLDAIENQVPEGSARSRNSMQGSPLKRAEEKRDERRIPAVKRPA